MNTLITLCRDIGEQASADCIEGHEAMDAPGMVPCRVERSRCDPTAAHETVGAEAESSAVHQREMPVEDCCDC